jgi:hypothetical protein
MSTQNNAMASELQNARYSLVSAQHVQRQYLGKAQQWKNGNTALGIGALYLCPLELILYTTKDKALYEKPRLVRAFRFRR